MLKKFLNVGKGYASDKLQHQQQDKQQQQHHQNQLTNNHQPLNPHQLQYNQQLQFKSQFQLNEIKSYGFSNLCCLGYSASLSLIAVGSKYGLLRVLGKPSVEFSYQLESANSIRQIEFIDCRPPEAIHGNQSSANSNSNNNKRVPVLASDNGATSDPNNTSAINQKPAVAAKILALTDNGQLHVFELKAFRGQNYADNTTQTDGLCSQAASTTPTAAAAAAAAASPAIAEQQQQKAPLEYTKLERTAHLDYFKFKPEEADDRSRRITTIEISSDGSTVFVGTEGGNLYQVPLDSFEDTQLEQQQQQHQQVKPAAQQESASNTNEAQNNNKRATNQETAPENSDEKPTPTGGEGDKTADDDTTAVNLNDEPQIEDVHAEPFEPIKFDEHVAAQLGDSIKAKKQGAVESIKRHPTSSAKILISYHRGLSVIYDVRSRSLESFFYHNQVLESSCFADQSGDLFYTSHNDGSYIKWDARKGSQTKAGDDFIGQLYGPYPCKPTLKIQACAGLVNDQLEDLLIFSGGMPRATYDDKNPVTIVRTESDGKDTIKTVLDFTSKVLDFAVITRPRGQLGAGAKSTGAGHGGGGKKNKHKQQQQQQQRNAPIAVALAILAEEEFVVIDLLNSESFLEFPLPYLNCVHSSSITCNQHYSDIGDELYQQLVAYNKQQFEGKLSANEWPITGGKVIDAPEIKSHDILLTGHEDGSVHFWDVSDLTMRHLLHLSTARFFCTNEDDLNTSDEKTTTESANQDDGASPPTEADNTTNENEQDSSSWPPLKRVGKFDPYSDDTRLAIRRLSLCPQRGTLVVAGTGGQVLVFQLKGSSGEAAPAPTADQITLVSDQRFAWKGRGKMQVRQNVAQQQLAPGYQLVSHVQLNPPVAATSLDLRSDWSLYALGTSYGFILYDYATQHCVVSKCTLNVQDFAIVGGGAPGVGTISRKKSFRKSLRESFRRLRRGRSQRNNPLASSMANPGSATGAGANSSPATGAGIKPAFGRATTGVRALNAPSSAPAATTGPLDAAGLVHRNVYSTERQVEPKVELSSIVRCVTLTPAVITSNLSFSPTLWVGTNAGHVLVYAITFASDCCSPASAEEQQSSNVPQQQQQKDAPAAAADSNTQAGSSTNLQPTPANKEPRVTARPFKTIQLKHKAPIIAIFTSPEAPRPVAEPRPTSTQQSSTRSSPEKSLDLLNGQQEKPAGSDSANNNNAPASPSKTSHQLLAGGGKQTGSTQQPRVLICSEEQFKVLNLPNLKRFCKFKLTAHEGLRAKTISITQFLKPATKQQQQSASSNANSKSLQSFATQTSPPSSPVPPGEVASETNAAKNSESNNNNSESTLNHNNNHKPSEPSSNPNELMNAKFGAKSSTAPSSSHQQQQQHEEADNEQANLLEPYMVCMSNQGDCAVYSVPDLKRQAQVQVCKREDVNGITSAMLTVHGEGYYLKSSSNFLRFSISSQRVPRVLAVL